MKKFFKAFGYPEVVWLPKSERSFLSFICLSFFAAMFVTPYPHLAMWAGFIFAAYAAIANKGVNKPLSLRKNNQNEGKRIIKEETASKILKMLEKVVVDGTSKKAKVEGYRVGGKSGTVWKISGTGGYSNDRYRAIFAGVAPIENPRLVAVVLIDEPTGEFYYGGDVAAPVFSEIISESLQLLAIPPNENVIESVLLAESSN